MPPDAAHSSDRVRRLLLSVPNRRRIFESILEVPGTHLRRISRDLRLAIGSVEHHLRQLEKHGLVFTHRAGRRRTYYASGNVDATDAAALHALRKPVWAVLLRVLLDEPECSLARMAARLGAEPAAVSYHLRRMRAFGLLEHLRVGRASVYLLRDAARIRRLFDSTRVGRPSGGPEADGAFQTLVARAQAEPGAPTKPVDTDGLPLGGLVGPIVGPRGRAAPS